MKNWCVVKIVFKDGSFSYYKNREIVVSSKDDALIVGPKYAEGLAEGINFAIQTYEDELVDHAEVEIL